MTKSLVKEFRGKLNSLLLHNDDAIVPLTCHGKIFGYRIMEYLPTGNNFYNVTLFWIAKNGNILNETPKGGVQSERAVRALYQDVERYYNQRQAYKQKSKESVIGG